MAELEFINNCLQIKAELNEAAAAFLHETAGEIVSQTKRNSRFDTTDTKGSYDYYVLEDTLTAVIGSPLENAIWEEFGTGEYALDHDGRKGGWYIPADKLDGKTRSKLENKYHFKKVTSKDGKTYYFTKGKKPNRPFFKAAEKTKPKLKRMLESKLGGVEK